jgi:hypothetical protein
VCRTRWPIARHRVGTRVFNRPGTAQPLVSGASVVSGCGRPMSLRRTDAAALTVALAGEDGASLAAVFAAPEGARLVAAARSLRSGESRAARARSLAVAGLRLLAPARAAAPSERAGARFFAAWVRSLDAADRAPFVRQLGPAALSALGAALPTAPVLDAAGRSTATFLLRCARDVAGRPLTLPEWSSLLEALAQRGSLSDAPLPRVDRVVRMSDRADDCRALAAAVCTP